MTVLLDTHVPLWWLAGDDALPRNARRIIRDGSNHVLVSAASALEIAIKRALGKLSAPAELEAAFEESHLDMMLVTHDRRLEAYGEFVELM